MPYADRQAGRVRHRTYMREVWYPRNREKHVRAVARSKPARKRKTAGLVNAEKARPCTDCGGTFPPCAMDFDHLRDKVATVSRLVGTGGSIERVRSEIEKCDLVCANCHRIRTWKRRQHTSQEVRP